MTGADHNPDVGRDVGQVRTFASEQIQLTIERGRVDRVQHGDRGPFGAAAMERRQHDADFQLALGQDVVGRPSREPTIAIMLAA